MHLRGVQGPLSWTLSDFPEATSALGRKFRKTTQLHRLAHTLVSSRNDQNQILLHSPSPFAPWAERTAAEGEPTENKNYELDEHVKNANQCGH